MTALMLHMVGWALVLMALAVLLPTAVLFFQTLGYLRAKAQPVGHDIQPVVDELRVCILMPAHNEELVIADTVSRLAGELGLGVSLLVVADNCSDRTAEMARAAGAVVTARTDPKRRGKGYALDHGLRALAADPPDVVLVLDADCRLSPGGARVLAAQAHAQQRPVQSRYIMDLPPDPGLKQCVAAFAWRVKTDLRVRGAAHWGWPCQLMGTGMALPWACVAKANLASGNLTEDVQLGIDLALNGASPVFCAQASVTSEFPSSAEGIQTQRTRWEQGQLGTAGSQLPRLLKAAWRERRPDLAAMAVDLLVPPLALLVLALLGTAIVQVAAGMFLGLWLGAVLTVVAAALLVTVIGLAWWMVGRPVISLLQLLAVPGYVLSKIPMYLRVLLGRGETQWVRTDRGRKHEAGHDV